MIWSDKTSAGGSGTAVPVGSQQHRAWRVRSVRGQLPTAGDPNEGLITSRVARVKLLPTGGTCGALCIRAAISVNLHYPFITSNSKLIHL